MTAAQGLAIGEFCNYLSSELDVELTPNHADDDFWERTNLDSIGAFELVVALEELGVELGVAEEQELSTLRTLRELHDFYSRLTR